MQVETINNNLIATWQRNGNDKNGNSIYLINFFYSQPTSRKRQWENVNHWLDKEKKDKNGNTRTNNQPIDFIYYLYTEYIAHRKDISH